MEYIVLVSEVTSYTIEAPSLAEAEARALVPTIVTSTIIKRAQTGFRRVVSSNLLADSWPLGSSSVVLLRGSR